jgi:hypothetical protein
LFDRYGPAFVVKVPTTQPAHQVVRDEGDLLEALSALPLGKLADTLPRPVGYLPVGDLAALVSTAVAGTPMTVRYHAWRHTAVRRRVMQDFAAAGAWLAELQTRTASGTSRATLLTESLTTIAARFPDHPGLATARRRLKSAAARLAAHHTPQTVVHGDFWFGNLLVDRDRVVGVVDWESGSLSGEPLRDLARFAVSYALYLDRHTRRGRRVAGHKGLIAGRWGGGVAHLLSGTGWLGEVVRDYLVDALTRLGLPARLWREVVLAGIADVAATADHPGFARAHLDLLIQLVAGRGGPATPAPATLSVPAALAATATVAGPPTLAIPGRASISARKSIGARKAISARNSTSVGRSR